MNNILITNTGFINKGAELMLRAIVQRYSGSNTKLVYQGVQKNASLAQKASLGLFTAYKFQRFKLNLSFLIPTDKFYNQGLIQEREIDVLLDAGGFHIGDKWIGTSTTKEVINRKLKIYKKYKKNGAKIIFLPQALGSFKKELSEYYFKELYALSDLFFARDKVSFEACKSVLKDTSKLFLAPDFTNTYKPVIENKANFESVKNKICIVPNAKMITHAPKSVSENYLNFLEQLVNFLNNKGEEIFFLNHEGQGDLDVIHSINKHHLTVITNVNADEVKSIIGNSKMLISSRFHGVVSGLSQAIPTFCTSWSHKYKELMVDYNMSEGVLNVENIEGSINVISPYLEESNRQVLIDDLKTKGKQEIDKTLKMWEKVDGLIIN